MRALEECRHELKITLEPLAHDSLVHQLRLHPAGFSAPYPPRWINNVYFDTFDLHAYEENLSGASRRAKVRYRWYGEQLTPGPGTLEVKCKTNQMGWKLSYPVKFAPYADGDRWQEIRRKIRAQVPPDAWPWLDANPQPVLINRYYREYFESRDQAVRVTLDTHIQVLEQRFKPMPNFTTRANVPDVLIMEIKFRPEQREVAESVIAHFEGRVSRHSKYITGVLSLANG